MVGSAKPFPPALMCAQGLSLQPQFVLPLGTVGRSALRAQGCMWQTLCAIR